LAKIYKEEVSMSTLNEVMSKIQEVYNHNLDCHKKIYEVEKEIPSNTDESKVQELKTKREEIFKKLIEKFTSEQDFGVKELNTEDKIELFRWILSNTESIITTGVMRNIILLVCSGSGTDDFSGDSSIWFSSVSQFTDCKIKLAHDIRKEFRKKYCKAQIPRPITFPHNIPLPIRKSE
jgi:hypothetical protein